MTEHLDQIAAALAGTSVLLILFGYILHKQHRVRHARLRVFVGGKPAAIQGNTQISAVRRRRSLLRGMRLGAQQTQLTQAGVVVTPRRFTFMQLVLGVLGGVMGRLAAGYFSLTGGALVGVTFIALIGGLAAPQIVLHLKRKQRLKAFESQFGDALDAMANAMEVGMSLSQTLESISHDMPAPLGPEFGHVLRELGLGLPIGEALDALAERVPLDDVQIFAAAVQIQYRSGGPLSYVLRTIAATVRERVNLRGEIRSMTAQQRISAYIISGVPVIIAVLMKFVSPAYFDKLLEPGTMRLLLFAGMAGIVAGFYFMMRIADIEV